MTKEQKCISFEVAKNLKELGAPQETEMFWVYFGDKKINTTSLMKKYDAQKLDRDSKLFHVRHPEDFTFIYAAYDIAELGELIDWELLAVSPPNRINKKWGYFTNDQDFFNESELQVRAEVLIHQLKKK